MTYRCGICGPLDLTDEQSEEHRDMHRTANLALSEAAGLAGAPVGWWYLSFCDPERPAGTRFLGGCFVQGHDEVSAVRRSHHLGINPGGEVAMMGPLTEAGPVAQLEAVAGRWCDRLLTREEIAEFDRVMGA
jgi:hypothetical protein